MLSIDISVIVIFAIVWILVLVLTKVYFKPVGRVMKEREKRLQKDRNSAQGAVEKYENALEKIEADMKAVKMKTRDIREKFERDAQKEREKIVEEVSRECRVHVEQARKELNEKVERIKKEMEPRNQDLAEKITKRLLN